MSLRDTYQKEIQALKQQVLQSNPRDPVQFCADFLAGRLASNRVAFLRSQATPERAAANSTANANMSSSGFTSPFGANSNPFGSAEGRRADATNLMQQVIEEDENDTVTSPTTPSFALKAGTVTRPPFGGDASFAPSHAAMHSPPPGEYPALYNFGRRTSVSAESLKPVADSYDNWSPPSHPKSPEQLERLKRAIEGNFLFSHLDEEQSDQILGALMEKPIPTKDIKVRRPITAVAYGLGKRVRALRLTLL